MLTIRRIYTPIGVKSKNILATLLFIDFSQTCDSINREKMNDILILIIYGISIGGAGSMGGGGANRAIALGP